MIAMTDSDAPDVQAAVLAFGADACLQKPVSCPRFLALGDLIKGVLCGHTQT
jgi:CheY-like chemotaxis protein